MASPYDSAIEMFNLPRFGTGGSPFPQREDPVTSARRRFLEGNAQQAPEDYVPQRAMESEDPFGVLQEVENLRREREEQGFISDIAALNPSGDTYGNDLLGLIQKNPRIAQSKGALGLIDVQRQLAPKPKDYTTQFRDPVYRSSYQQKVKGGLDPDMAYEQTLSEAANEDMAIDLIKAGIPAERHGELMTGGAFDRRKVAQAIYGAKPRPGYDLPLSGEAREQFEGIVQELAQARSGTAEPTDEEKRQFLTPRANTTWTEQEWAEAYNKAKPLAQQRALAEANNRLNQFRQTYGDYYKLPEGLGGMASTAPHATAPLAPQTDPAPLSTPGAPLTPSTAQNALQAPPVPQEQPSPTDRIPSLNAGVQSPAQKYSSVAGELLSNIPENISFDPLGSVAKLTRPGGLQEMMIFAPPSQEEQNKSWTDAKTTVREFLQKLPGTPEEKLKIIGSMAKEETVPQDLFTKEKLPGQKAYISAASALVDAMKEANPNLPKSALRDKDGTRDWMDVARVVALEELENMGYITRSQSPPAQTKAPNIKAIRLKQ